MHVLVTFSVAIPPPDIVLVCARFEPTRVAPLWPAGLADLARTVGATGGRQENKCRLEIGERAALPESLFGSAARAASDDGEWILAERESTTNQQTVSQVWSRNLEHFQLIDIYLVCEKKKEFHVVCS